jgi:CubicO group peptidase (beta-lactamase class C family)
VIPTANIPHDNRYILPLRSSSTADDDFSAVFQGKNQELSDIAEHQFLDGLLILRYDQIVVERYFGALTPERPHLMMSVTKSVVGLLAGRLAERGVITSG